MDLEIAGRRALVCASSAGLGLSTAKALAEAGCKVVVSGRTEPRLTMSAEAIGATPIQNDVSTPEGALDLVAQAREVLGGIDILVANAGGPPPGNFASIDFDLYEGAISQNLLSVVAMCKEVIPEMQAQKWGRVLAITSISVRQPIPDIILSNTARAGLTAFLKTTALEVAGDGVTVNSIQPGLHATARLGDLGANVIEELGKSVPVGQVGDSDDFGRVAAFLCSESAKYIVGAAIPVAGGSDQGLQ